MDQWRRLSSCWRQNNQMMNDECDKVIIYRDELQYCFIVYVCTSTKESANWLCPACVWLTHWVLSMVCLWLVVTWLGSPVVSNVTDTPLTPLLTPVRVGAGAGGLRPGWPGQLRASGRGRVSHQSGSGQRRSLMSHVSHRGFLRFWVLSMSTSDMPCQKLNITLNKIFGAGFEKWIRKVGWDL